MKVSADLVSLLGGLAALSITVSAYAAPDVDTRYPYTGPAVPIGDWVGNTVKGNGKGFPRIVEPPAVAPASSNPTNNINVISLSYMPKGMHIHYQTPFGLGKGVKPSVKWGTNARRLNNTAIGNSRTYDRTPPCSEVAVTQCSQHFHEVSLPKLAPATTYYYMIPAANGTTASPVLSFTTAREAGDKDEFSVALLCDMGYINAAGTYNQLVKGVTAGEIAFAWHGGDLSYADDWYSGILPCDSSWPVCYNGSHTALPGNGPIPEPYLTPLPKGEVPNQGGPNGGDMSVIYESNWDLWQQWINNITMRTAYMVLPGNHEATCAEFDGGKNILTAYLNEDRPNSTAAESALTYYSCPPSQRNFTAFQHRFHMPGKASGGVGNFWYSFDYGMAHFIAIDTETDFPNSPEYPFARDVDPGEALPTPNQTYPTDSGPFGYIKGNLSQNAAYEQYNWLVSDLKKVDRTKTPWVIAMGHRPMYSSQVSGYQANIRNAFQSVFLEYGVDAYTSGHIHFYERLFPLTATGQVDQASVVNNHTYRTNEGTSMLHIVNGMAGNIESHSTISGPPLNISANLNMQDYGFSKFTFYNSSVMSVTFVKGTTGQAADKVTLVKSGKK